MENRISNTLSVLANYLHFIMLKLISKKPIRVYYWKEHPNFGDLITPALLEYYGYPPIFFNPNRAQLVSTGSLIEHLNEDYKGIILGTGAISESTSIEFKKAKVIGLRGALTKKALHIENDIIYGDPGLLASKLIEVRNIKKFKIGFIPHYRDIDNEHVFRLMKRLKNEITIIDVQNKPLDVLKKMDQCEYILSSSLHGLICADSLGIPNRWIKLSELMGNEFKFNDYYSIFELKARPKLISGNESIDELISWTEMIEKEKINKVKIELENQFKNLVL